MAEELAAAGHDVTMIRWRIYNYKFVDVKVDPAVKRKTLFEPRNEFLEWFWDAYVDIDYDEMMRNHSRIAFQVSTLLLFFSAL